MVSQILDEMIAIRNLSRMRQYSAHCIRKGTGPIPADHLDFWMRGEPGHDRSISSTINQAAFPKSEGEPTKCATRSNFGHRKTTSSTFHCSCCHKPKDQVEQLLAGPRGTPFAPPALIAASRSCEMRAREAASPSPLINAPRSCRLLHHSQTQRGRKGGWNPERVELHRRLPLRAGIAGQSLCPRQPAMCYPVELQHSMKIIRTSSYLRWRGAFCPAVSF
jgi:hypothetical protein